MLFAISTLAFADPAEEAALLPLLKRAGVDALEVAPTKRWPRWAGADLASARRYREALLSAGFSVTALQSIVFEQPQLQLFGADFAPWLAHFQTLSEIAEGLGARTLVFGAPQQRDPGDCAEPLALAAERFRALATQLQASGAVLALEPVPESRFIQTPAQAQQLAASVAHPAFDWHFDSAAWAQSGADLGALLAVRLPPHAHLSQPQLVGPSSGPVDLLEVILKLRIHGYAQAFSFEILSGRHHWPTTLDSIERLIGAARDAS